MIYNKIINEKLKKIRERDGNIPSLFDQGQQPT